MATFDYADIRDNVVVPAIQEFGKSATLTQPGTPTGPVWDPTPGTPTSYSVKVLTTAFTAADKAGTLVREDDLKFLMSTQGNPVPDLKGTLAVDGDTLQVIKLEPKNPGPTVVFWYVYCRR